MTDRDSLLAALHADPGDDTARLALADVLEEEGEPGPALLLRSLAWVRMHPGSEERPAWEHALRDLLLRGERPCVPAVTNSLGMRFALVPPGQFWMGSPDHETGRFEDEGPMHLARVARPFYLGAHAVTQAQYAAVMGSNPATFSAGGGEGYLVRGMDTGQFPVDSVTWEAAVAFCERLSGLSAEADAGRRYALPTEAMWEYACRGGILTPLPYHFGAGLPADQARFDFRDEMHLRKAPRVRYAPHPAPVGSFAPNAWGLYDMHGNVWEWCSDWFTERGYAGGPGSPRGRLEPGSVFHVLRGGSWYSRATVCRTACRNPVAGPNTRGFRVVLLHPHS